MLEIVSKRTENSKTFDLGEGKRQLVTGGTVHYKDNYEDKSEQWKDIDLTFVNGRIDKAPYILEVDGLTITLTSKKTGTVQTLTLDRIGANPPQRPVPWQFANNKATWGNAAPVTDIAIEAGANTVRFKRILKNANVPMEATFTHSKSIGRKNDISFSVSARDADGEPLETTKSDIAGVLTEWISNTVDLSKVKFPIEIDPTLTVQPSTKDTDMFQTSQDVCFGNLTYFRVYDLSTNKGRAILEFDISGLPANATLSSASLQLYYYLYSYDDPVGRTIWAYKQIRTDWIEGVNESPSTAGATWNDYKIVGAEHSTWTTAGGDYVTSNPSGGSTTFPASYGWMSWNVLDIVQDAYVSSIAAEFLVKMADETKTAANDSFNRWYSNDYTTDTDLCPKLVINYDIAIVKIAAEIIGLTDEIIKRSRAIRLLAETLGITDSAILRARSLRLSAETLGITEVKLLRARAVRIISSTLGLLDVEVLRARSTRLIAETVGLVDLLIKRAYSIRWATEAIGITDLDIRKLSSIRLLSSSVGLSEADYRRAYSARLTVEVVGLTESLINRLRSIRLIAETVGITESLLRRFISIRIISEAVGLVDTAIKRARSIRLSLENIGIEDVLVLRKRAIRLITETLGIVDASIKASLLIKILSEVVGFVDSGIHRFRSIRIKADILSIVDSPIRRDRAIRFIEETLGIVETFINTGIPYLVKIMTEAIGLIDRSGRTRRKIGTILEAAKRFTLGTLQNIYSMGKKEDKYSLGKESDSNLGNKQDGYSLGKSKDDYDLGG